MKTSSTKRGSSFLVLFNDNFDSSFEEKNFKSDNAGVYDQEVLTNEELDVLEEESQESAEDFDDIRDSEDDDFNWGDKNIIEGFAFLQRMFYALSKTS